MFVEFGDRFQFQMVRFKAVVDIPALEALYSFNSKWCDLKVGSSPENAAVPRFNSKWCDLKLRQRRMERIPVYKFQFQMVRFKALPKVTLAPSTPVSIPNGAI